MLSIQFSKTGGPEVLEAVEIDLPSPGPNEVLIKTKCISVNYADTQVRRGVYPVMPPLPAVPGLEASGYVEKAGPGMEHLQPGQPVLSFGQGCYAEYIIVPASTVTVLPTDVDMSAAAALQVNYLTGFHLLHSIGNIESNRTILVSAIAGGVGTAVLQLAKLADATTIGLTSKSEKAEFAIKQGADHVINYKTENVVARVKEITDGRGVDLILDSVQGKMFAHNFEMLAPFGRLVWFGGAAGPAQVDLMQLMRTHAALSPSAALFNLYTLLGQPGLWAKSLGTLLDHLAAGKIKPVISRQYALTEAAKAHAFLESGDSMGKIILNA
jgi:NADPH2:quinone reductase